jgi:chromosome segregation ATPase
VAELELLRDSLMSRIDHDQTSMVASQQRLLEQEKQLEAAAVRDQQIEQAELARHSEWESLKGQLVQVGQQRDQLQHRLVDAQQRLATMEARHDTLTAESSLLRDHRGTIQIRSQTAQLANSPATPASLTDGLPQSATLPATFMAAGDDYVASLMEFHSRSQLARQRRILAASIGMGLSTLAFCAALFAWTMSR